MANNMLSSAQSTEVFTLFPKLAPELRDMIWKEALPRARMVTISAVTVHARDVGPENWNTPSPLLTNARPVPCGLFHVCQESRAVALNRYSLAFENVVATPLYIDWVNDTLCLNSWEPMYRMCSLSVAPMWQVEVHHLALNWHLPRAAVEVPCGIRRLTNLPKLQTLVVEKPHSRPGLLQGWAYSQPQVKDYTERQTKILRAEWMKELDTSDESKLPRITWLELDDFERKIEDEKTGF